MDKKKDWTLWQKLKKFRGVTASLLKITLNDWDGYGLTVLNLSWNYVRTVTFTTGGSLFHISWRSSHESDGYQWDLKMSVFFYQFTAYTWVIEPRKKMCVSCEENYCKTEEFFLNGKAYCSKYCQEMDN